MECPLTSGRVDKAHSSGWIAALLCTRTLLPVNAIGMMEASQSKHFQYCVPCGQGIMTNTLLYIICLYKELLDKQYLQSFAHLLLH